MLRYISTWEFLRTLEKYEKHSPSARASPHCSLFSFKKCIMNCARSYRWRRLRALYLNSALVWRRARALWKYNELVLTNHSAHISLNILFETSYKTHGGGGGAFLLLLKSLNVLFHFVLVAIAVIVYLRSLLTLELSSTDLQQLVLNSLGVISEFCLSHLGWNLHWWGRGARYRFLHLHQKLQRFFRLWRFLR